MSELLKHVKPGITQETRLEKIHNVIFDNSKIGSKEVAREIADLIKYKQSKKQKCVLGLATGSSPITVYEELINIHEKEKLSFKNVITFNLDEYYPLSPENSESYYTKFKKSVAKEYEYLVLNTAYLQSKKNIVQKKYNLTNAQLTEWIQKHSKIRTR